MAGNGSNNPTVQARLKPRLQKLADLKDELEAAKLNLERATTEYKTFERDTAEVMTDEGITSIKFPGLGQFNLQTRTFVKITDMTVVMKWAAAAGLLSDVRDELGEDGQPTGRLIIPFEQLREPDPETGKDKLVLINGIIKAMPAHKPISDHTKEQLADTDTLPEGVEMSPSMFITWRRR